MANMEIMDFVNALEGRAPRIMETRRECAVFIPLVEHKGVTYVLFEVRSDEIRRQPGEVCFPGGVLEDKEKPKDCAVRETVEELGVAHHQLRVIGAFDVLHNYTNVTIHTFVGTMGYEAFQNLKLNKDEVKEAFLVPISFFLENEPYVYNYDVLPDIKEDFPYDKLDSPDKYNWVKGRCTVPIFNYEGRIIWGMTARILCHLLETVRNG